MELLGKTLKAFASLFILQFITNCVSDASYNKKPLQIKSHEELSNESGMLDPINSTFEYFDSSDHNTGVKYTKASDFQQDAQITKSTNSDKSALRILLFSDNGRIGHFINDSSKYQLSFRCLSGSINIEKYIGIGLPSYETVKCSGQTAKIEISDTYFLELTTRYLGSVAKIDKIKFRPI